MAKYNFIDMTNQVFDRLTVIERAKNDKHGNAMWLCKCECGTETIVSAHALRQGRTRSCGCLLSECSKQRMTKLMTKHKMAGTKLYSVYSSMRERCEKPSYAEYHRYGGRGIYVCDEWKKDRTAFFEWALSHGYKEGLQIDRINNDGNYCPENCHWVTALENGRNTSRCIPVIAVNCATGEKTHCRSINEAVELTGLNFATIKRFINGKSTKTHQYRFEKVFIG